MNIKSTITILMVCFVACNIDEKITDAISEALDILCTPGEEISCVCENGVDGSQTCDPDGIAFSDCACEESFSVGECTPGELDVCVCEDENFGTRTCLGNKEWDDCYCKDEMESEGIETDTDTLVCLDDEIDTCACGTDLIGTHLCKDNVWQECICEETLPQPPVWGLFDVNKKLVSAIIEPICQGEKNNTCLFEPDVSKFPCVYIKYLENNPIWISFDLITGKPDSCYNNIPNWTEGNPATAFKSSDCTGIPWSEQPFGNLPLRDIIRVQNDFYWADPKQISQPWGESYIFENGECVPNGAEDFYEISKVPDELLNILENPPYTISLVK